MNKIIGIVFASVCALCVNYQAYPAAVISFLASIDFLIAANLERRK